ncbi:CopG family transcriptional regulator [Caulobacter segnis]|uniref:CopG family transcriptional regulator n=1 Tax=Caulobacter segnis TaxID=88688 RepID=UPI00285E35DF|nr:CopG family transcriptional regulator [Caulobacter segnis]MDR6623820.1 putative transcriptional regulator [Caulobacter segnis]
MKDRHQIWLETALGGELDRLGAKPGASKSAIVAAALRAFFERQASAAVDDLLRLRLDRMTRALGRLERNQQVLLESLALFVRYQLTVTAPLPEADKAAQAIGRERFQRFVDQVGRQLAAGRATFPDPEGGEG